MSTAPPDPTPSPVPNQSPARKDSPRHEDGTRFSNPKLRLQINDLDHCGASIFLENTKPTTVLADAIAVVLQILYKGNLDAPPVRSVTLVLRPVGGVAGTAGLELDNEHKEIYFSLNYIAGLKSESASRQREEIFGVIVHEMVHVWQWNGHGTAPGGLIEGIADFVRLKAGLAPPQWKREPGDKWDAGYSTTGYFLEWIDKCFGDGKVREINQKLKVKYKEDEFWPNIFGKQVDELWQEYKREVSEKSTEAATPVGGTCSTT